MNTSNVVGVVSSSGNVVVGESSLVFSASII
jgi:hypothetical protein